MLCLLEVLPVLWAVFNTSELDAIEYIDVRRKKVGLCEENLEKKTVLESRTFKMKSNVHHAAVGLNMFDLWNHFEMCLLVAHAIA